jgi:hypothetical protein
MFYKLLGIAVWKGGKYFLRRRYSTYVPMPVIAGAAVALAGGIVLLVVRHSGSDD